MNHAADIPVLLCVDDEPNVLSALRRVFRPQGYQVLLANGGAEGLDILRQQPVDLVISDMRMPAMNGAEFLAKVAKEWPQVMRLLLTGHAEMDAAIQAINAGHIYGYYNKPCEDAELRLGVENALKQKRLTEERDLLLTQLEQRNQALKALNTELDSKVKVRTAQLQTAMEQLKSTNQNLKKHYSDTVRAFSRFVDLREGKSSGHARRVADQARHLGQEMGLQVQELQDIVFAGMLLQVGKLSLPDRLIEKPMLFLQKHERDNFLRHPTVGASVLRDIAPLRQAARLIALQNECFDGSGVPNGLAGDDIPMGARLLAVVRDYDLMLEGHISGKTMTTAEAQNQLRRLSGKKYDPKVVNALIQLVGQAKAQSYRPVVEASPLDLIAGMEVVEIIYGGHVFLRDAVLTEEIIEEIDELNNNVDTALTIRVRART
jgi:response regulator RpfG family c-di-GMP phosphodiesterase